MGTVQVKLDVYIPTQKLLFPPFPWPLINPPGPNSMPFWCFGSGSEVWCLSLQFHIQFPGQVSLASGLIWFGTSGSCQHVSPPAFCLLISSPTRYCPKFPLLPLQFRAGGQWSEEAEDGRADNRQMKRTLLDQLFSSCLITDCTLLRFLMYTARLIFLFLLLPSLNVIMERYWKATGLKTS